MACSACGSPLESGVRFCSRCGVAVTPPAPMYSSLPFAPEARVRRHLRQLGILWMVYGAMPLMGWLIALPFLGLFGFGFPLGHHGILAHLPWTAAAWVPFVTMILALMGGASFLVGFSLMRRLAWGRGLAIVLAFWALIHPIFGTALGAYTLWVLMPETSAWEYQQMAM